MKRLLLLASALLLLGFSGHLSLLQDPIKVDGGLVAGMQLPDSPVRVYKGIPFAAPPVGEIRWRAPQPVIPWQGVKQADTFSHACIQELQGSRLPWSEEFMHQGEMSEDCLYLNIWTSAENAQEKLPVMVWFHGGGYVEGSSAIVTYDGEAFAKKGVVLVGINYRLGPIGYMAHPELTQESKHKASGNYGFLDQIAALKWVQANIEAFGGDPTNVTIFGQSAGAGSVAVLMKSPLAKGLFAKGIRQSGSERRQPFSARNGTPLAEAEQIGLAAQETLGVRSLAELRQVPAERFVNAELGRMRAVEDGWFMPAGPLVETVPVMAGFTADDGFSSSEHAKLTVETYQAEAQELYGEHAATYLTLYPANASTDFRALKLEAARDRARVSVSVWAKQQKKSRSVYTYFFDRAIPWPEHPEFGAFHTSEVPYVFNTLGALDRPWEEVDRTVADQTSSYWVNFAKTGNPNGAGLAKWPAADASNDVTMRLGETMGAMPTTSPEKAQFWKTILTESLD